jgi:hypothetical protein
MDPPAPLETARVRLRPPVIADAMALAVVGVPLMAFAVHAAAFGDWIVDDAGISFAYARNLAAGHGLVAQPGVAPVEGYSNFLWVLLLVPLFSTGLFHPAWTPKVAGLVLSGGAFLLLDRALRSTAGWTPLCGLAAFSLIALQTSVVAWSVSGLENALYVFVLAGLSLSSMEALDGRRGPGVTGALAGLLAAAAAMTRPDGVLYGAALPMLLAARRAAGRAPAGWIRLLGTYAGTVALALGAFLAFRWWYFRDLLPNPYYAKGGPALRDVAALAGMSAPMREKVLGLLEAVAGPARAPALAALLAGTLVLAWRRRLDRGHLVVGTFLGLSALAYLLLPGDWMKEYRFATPFFVFLYAYAVMLAWPLCEMAWRGATARQLGFVAVAAVLLLATLTLTLPRSVRFVERPPLPLAIVAEVLGRRFNRFAAALGLDGPEGGSILLSDVGGALLYSRLRVHDLHGLCDATIARTLGRYRNLPAFHEYVLGDLRPVFIHLATADWVSVTRFDADPRFSRDYAPITELLGRDAPRRFGLDAYPGEFFIRREAARVRS